QNERFAHYEPEYSTIYGARYRFTGKELDRETGYTYNEQRYLCTDAGIWLSVDPLVDKYLSISPYNYCNWNPIKYVDPNGQEWESEADQQYAQKLRSAINNKISQIDKQRSHTYNKNRRKELSDRRDILESALVELNEMEETTKCRFRYASVHKQETAYTELSEDGLITMYIDEELSIELGIHESSHAYDMYKSQDQNSSANCNSEIKAYSRQLSLMGILPQSICDKTIGGFISVFINPQKHHKLKDITPDWVRGIYYYNPGDENADIFGRVFPYKKYN
ncbi:MAG: RHS repeat-associated core domain-containing protein, partial [Paludibacteraceae bacterium]|nr:RHS repeat-associated core domain-containing protein [Paludibacteraceae bacterium]